VLLGGAAVTGDGVPRAPLWQAASRPNHARLGEDVAHMRLRRCEIHCLLEALEGAGDEPRTTEDQQLAARLSARLVDLLRGLG
jgi:hypothetical protein